MDTFEKVVVGVAAAWAAAVPLAWWRLRRRDKKNEDLLPTGILHTRDFRRE